MLNFSHSGVFISSLSLLKNVFMSGQSSYTCFREEVMQERIRSTNAKMCWLSLLSIVIALSVGGLQLWHLKSFFEKKKLI